jgi:hypothetical protein
LVLQNEVGVGAADEHGYTQMALQNETVRDVGGRYGEVRGVSQLTRRVVY